MEENTPSNNNRGAALDRRAALKALTAATGAAGLAALPARWSKPALRVGAIPAHAQTSCTDYAFTLEIVESIPEALPVMDYSALPDSRSTSIVFVGDYARWNCGVGCFWVHFYNNGASGTATWDVTILGGPLPVGPLGINDDFWIVLNEAALQYDTSTDALPPDSFFTDLGCAPPPGM